MHWRTLFRTLKQMYKFHSASVRYSTLHQSKCGVLEIEFGGVLTAQAVLHLWPLCQLHTRKAPALVVRLDRAALVYDDPDIIPIEQVATTPPTAIVVPPALYERYKQFACKVSAMGILRAAFLPSQVVFAYQWAEFHCRLADSPQWLASRQRRPESGFAPL